MNLEYHIWSYKPDLKRRTSTVASHSDSLPSITCHMCDMVAIITHLLIAIHGGTKKASLKQDLRHCLRWHCT